MRRGTILSRLDAIMELRSVGLAAVRRTRGGPEGAANGGGDPGGRDAGPLRPEASHLGLGPATRRISPRAAPGPGRAPPPSWGARAAPPPRSRAGTHRRLRRV